MLGSNFSGEGYGVIKIYSHAVFAPTLLLISERLIKGTKECGERATTESWQEINRANVGFFSVPFAKMCIYFYDIS